MTEDFPPCLPGDFSELNSAQSNFQQIANTAAKAKVDLQNQATSLLWRGLAFDQFVTLIAELPVMLGKISDSFSIAAAGLSNYVNGLEYWSGEYSSKLPAYYDARDNLVQAQIQLANSTNADTTSLQQRVDEYQSGVDASEAALRHIYSMASGLAVSLKNQLDAASQAGVQNNPINTAQRWGGDAAKWGDDAVNFVVSPIVRGIQDVVKGIVEIAKAEIGLFAAVTMLVETGNWSKFSTAVNQAVETGLKGIHDLSSGLSSVLGYLVFVPGLGEVVGVVLLALAVVSVVDDLAFAAEGYSAEGYGTSALLGDSISLVTSVATGGVEKDLSDSVDESVSEMKTWPDEAMDSRISHEQGWVTRVTNAGGDPSPYQARLEDLKTVKDIQSIPDSTVASNLTLDGWRQSARLSKDLSKYNPRIDLNDGLHIPHVKLPSVSYATVARTEKGLQVFDLEKDRAIHAIWKDKG